MNRILNNGLQQWLLFLVFVLLILRTESLRNISITYVESAVEKGAVCLDGSPPAYHLDRGSGNGINNWLLHIEGGGWCQNTTVCRWYSKTNFGSSTLMATEVNFYGILSDSSIWNPDFYNWNRVRIRYCDGGSFTGDVEQVDHATKLYYRGSRIFTAVIEDLLEKGMINAENALLSGCSAGGLASILHCDNFKSLLPKHTKVKCLADAGFFLDMLDVEGVPYSENYFEEVVTMHQSAKNLPQYCTSKMKPSLCFFPQNIVKGITTPLFIVNSAYDAYQFDNLLVPPFADPLSLWDGCKEDLTNCSASQLSVLQGMRSELVSTLTGLGTLQKRGYFISNFLVHCQTGKPEIWSGPQAPTLKNKSISKAVADWFLYGTPFQEIACSYQNAVCDQ